MDNFITPKLDIIAKAKNKGRKILLALNEYNNDIEIYLLNPVKDEDGIRGYEGGVIATIEVIPVEKEKFKIRYKAELALNEKTSDDSAQEKFNIAYTMVKKYKNELIEYYVKNLAQYRI